MSNNILNLLSEDTFSEKMDIQNRLLAAIASNSGGVTVKSWADVQTIVRAGLADKFFAIGDQFVCKRNDTEIVWDVIGIDCDTPSNPAFTHSLTLQTHALHFKKGFCSNSNLSNEWVNETGNANEFLRFWLNSAEAGGFLNGLDEDFVSALGAVDKITAVNDGNSVIGSVSSDKFFVLSQTEIFGTANLGIEEGSKYPFFTTADDVKKYYADGITGTPYYFTRSKAPTSSTDTIFSTNKIKTVKVENASLYDASVPGSYGVAIACCII